MLSFSFSTAVTFPGFGLLNKSGSGSFFTAFSNRSNAATVGSTDFVINQAGDLDKKKFTPTSVANGVDAIAYYYDGDNFSKGIRYNNNTIPLPDGGVYSPRTYYEKEYEDNEERRKIKVIRPEFIRRVVSEFERIMSA